MVRKLLLLLGFVAVILIVVLFRGIFSGQESVASTYDLSGRITEVKANSIIFQGTISLNGKVEDRTVELIFNKKADFKKMSIVITKEQFTKGGSFQPETPITPGAFSDLDIGTSIFEVQSREDLFTKDKVKIDGIYYLLYEYDFPLPH